MLPDNSLPQVTPPDFIFPTPELPGPELPDSPDSSLPDNSLPSEPDNPGTAPERPGDTFPVTRITAAAGRICGRSG